MFFFLPSAHAALLDRPDILNAGFLEQIKSQYTSSSEPYCCLHIKFPHLVHFLVFLLDTWSIRVPAVTIFPLPLAKSISRHAFPTVKACTTDFDPSERLASDRRGSIGQSLGLLKTFSSSAARYIEEGHLWCGSAIFPPSSKFQYGGNTFLHCRPSNN